MVCIEKDVAVSPYSWVGEFVDNKYEQLFDTRNKLLEITTRTVICELIRINFATCNNDADKNTYQDSQNITDQGRGP